MALCRVVRVENNFKVVVDPAQRVDLTYCGTRLATRERNPQERPRDFVALAWALFVSLAGRRVSPRANGGAGESQTAQAKDRDDAKQGAVRAICSATGCRVRRWAAGPRVRKAAQVAMHTS